MSMSSRSQQQSIDKLVKPYLAKLKRERRLVTYGDEARELFADRRNFFRAIGSIHARLSREVAGRYPGTEWVVTARGEVLGPYTRAPVVGLPRFDGHPK